MTRRSSATLSTLLGAALTVAFVAGCGSATTTATPTPSTAVSPSATPGVSSTAAGSLAPSDSTAASDVPGSPAASATAAACLSSDPGMAHISASLEDLLPSTIGGVCLEKFSLVLSAYISSPPTGGDKDLYAAWLLKFGKTTDDVNMAVTADLSQPPKVNFNVHAIEVPGAAAASLASSFDEVAKAAGWPVTSHPNYLPGKSLLEITNPATGHLGYVYAKDDVLYTVITDDQSLLTEALVKLP